MFFLPSFSPTIDVVGEEGTDAQRAAAIAAGTVIPAPTTI
jgi:hypothetical protein